MKIMGNSIATGAFVGLIVGIPLECLNGFFAFLLPPILIIMPVCIGIGVLIGLAISKRA
ncbi:MAG TPA: hypothetical protein VKJ65_06690 [Phycisphaerae bacterium]|nr:hypothetical protein [Phycisphaerae bacterium]